MAIDYNLQDEEEQQGQGPQGSGGGVVSVSPASGNSKSGAPAQTQVSGANPVSGTQGFTNLDQYLDANQSQGNDLANSVSSKVNSQVSGAQNAIDQMNENYANDVSNATVSDNTNLDSQIANGNAAQIASDPTQVSAFQKELNASWNPNSALNSVSTDTGSGYDEAYQQMQNAQQAAQNTQTEGGQFQLLDQFFGNPNYTAGDRNLDEYLLSNNTAGSDGASALDQFQNTASNLQGIWNNALSSDNGLAQDARATNQATQQNALNSLYGENGNFANPTGGAYGALDSALNSELSTAQTNDQALQNAYNAFENSPTSASTSGLGLSAADQAVLSNAEGLAGKGLTPQQLQAALSYSGPQNETLYGVANPNQQAELSALSQLSGNSYTPGAAYTPAQVSLNVGGILGNLGVSQANGKYIAPSDQIANSVSVPLSDLYGIATSLSPNGNLNLPGGQTVNVNNSQLPSSESYTPEQLLQMGATLNPDGTFSFPQINQTVGTALNAGQQAQQAQYNNVEKLFSDPESQALYEQLFGSPYAPNAVYGT